MIKNRNIADDAAIEMHKLLGPGQTGEVYWVATVGTQAYQYLRDRVKADKLFTSLEEAGNAVVASSDALVFMAPHHAETVASAAAINLDKIGMRIVGLGSGAARPTFTFSATDSTITITAASIAMKNFITKPSIDSVVSPIVVSAADVTLDFENQDATSEIECVNALLTAAGADRLTINLRYRGFIAGNACVNAIRLVGVDTARIYVDFYGVASTAIVEFHTTNCHDIDISGKFYNDGTTLTKSVVDTIGSSTWSVQGWDGNSNANFTGGDNKTIAAADIETIASDLVAADLVIDKIYSDSGNIRTDATEILSDLETVKSDLVAADLVIDKIYSDTGNIRAQEIEILSDLETIGSDLIAADLVIDKIYSDSGNIRDDVTEILSDLETIKSDLLAKDLGVLSDLETIMSDVIAADLVIDKIYSDSGNIRDDVTEILSDLETVKSDLIAKDLGVLSDLETISSDLIAADLVIDKIYSDTGNIRAQEIEILSDLETIGSDLIAADLVIDKIYSDTGNIRAQEIEILSDLETISSDLTAADLVIDKIYSDTSIITLRQATGKIVSDVNSGNASDSTVIDISDVGVLTGISQMLNAAEAVDGTLVVRIDGVQLISSALFTSYLHASSDVVVRSLNFHHPFETSLHINHQKNVATGTLNTTVAYTTD